VIITTAEEVRVREKVAKERIRLLEKMVPLAKERSRLKAEIDKKRYEASSRCDV
jgi:hypothetical protein